MEQVSISSEHFEDKLEEVLASNSHIVIAIKLERTEDRVAVESHTKIMPDGVNTLEAVRALTEVLRELATKMISDIMNGRA